MTTAHDSGISVTKDVPNSATYGCCTRCEIRATCPTADVELSTCAVTGSAPPPPPPAEPPQIDYTAVADRVVEKTLGGVFGFGWTDLAATINERTNAEDADGNPVDWSRLQLRRNFLSIAIATAVPLGERTAAMWVAESIRTFGLTGAPLAAAGGVVCACGAVFLGSLAPGLIGLPFVLARSVLVLLGKGALRFITSRFGWVITRPAIWAGVCGLLIVTGRPLIHALTGA